MPTLGRLTLAVVGAWTIEQAVAVRAVVDVGAPSPDGTVLVAVRVQPEGGRLGSYQGTLRFAPGSLRVVSVAAPRGGDATRMMNAADTATGVIRYAGFTVTRFQHDTVLTLRVRPARTMAQAQLVASLEVAADSAGTRIPRERLAPSSGARPRP
jgi:hypothetical protein